jgi:hypothetical protein
LKFSRSRSGNGAAFSFGREIFVSAQRAVFINLTDCQKSFPQQNRTKWVKLHKKALQVGKSG